MRCAPGEAETAEKSFARQPFALWLTATRLKQVKIFRVSD
jgi:hypothetical protein